MLTEELHSFYLSPNIIGINKLKTIRGTECAARIGNIKAYKMLIGKPEVKRSLEIRRCEWEDNIKKDLEEIRWEDVYWINLP